MRRLADVRPVVTGPLWMGSGVGSIQTALEEMIEGAQLEIHLLSYSMSDGAHDLLTLIGSRLRHGIIVTMVAERLETYHGTIVEHLEDLVREYPTAFRLYEFAPTMAGALHAKCAVVDRKRALIGSANLSFNGLIQNYELGVTIDGPVAGDLAGIIERLIPHPNVRRIMPPSSENEMTAPIEH